MDAEGRDYFQAVERHFIERRGAPLMLSPADVARVAAWHGQGVPLAAVREGIDVHFDRLERRGRAPRRAVTLAYLEDDVVDAWLAAKSRRLGRPRAEAVAGSVGEAAASLSSLEIHAGFVRQLREAASRLAARAGAGVAGDGAVGDALRQAAAKLEAKAALFDPAAPGHDEQRAEDHLRRLERWLLERAAEAMGEAAVAAVAAAVDGGLAPRVARMTPAAAERVRKALMDRRLRERFGLTRLSLFYT